MLGQFCDKICEYCFSISEAKFQEDLVVHYFVGPFATAIPDNNLLKSLAFYYDAVVVPSPCDLLNPAFSFFRKRGWEKIAANLMKKYQHIKEWIDGGFVRLLHIDSKDVDEVVRGTVSNEYSDKDFWKFMSKIGPLYGYSELTKHVRSKYVRECGTYEKAISRIIIEGDLFYTNRAILCSLLCNGTPLSKPQFSQHYLEYKIQRIASLDSKIRIPALLNSILNVTLPYADKLSIREIFDIRAQRKNSFARFRRRISNLAMKIKSTPWNSQFQDEVSQLIKNEVIPELQEVRKQMRELHPNIKITTLKAFVSQIPYIGLFSDFHDVIKTWRLKKRLEENSLYFITQL